MPHGVSNCHRRALGRPIYGETLQPGGVRDSLHVLNECIYRYVAGDIREVVSLAAR